MTPFTPPRKDLKEDKLSTEIRVCFLVSAQLGANTFAKGEETTLETKQANHLEKKKIVKFL